VVQRFGFVFGIFVIAGCTTTPSVVGNDAYAMVAVGKNADGAAQLWCKAYGKVPQLREQDTMHGTVTYDCVGVFASGAPK
jgi:hypothetical protein